MSRAEDEHNAVEALLAGAAKTIGNVHYCWLVTEAEHGDTNPRPMGGCCTTLTRMSGRSASSLMVVRAR